MVPLHGTAIKKNEKDLCVLLYTDAQNIFSSKILGYRTVWIVCHIKRGENEDVYIFAYIFTKKQWKNKTKTSKSDYLYKKR